MVADASDVDIPSGLPSILYTSDPKFSLAPRSLSMLQDLGEDSSILNAIHRALSELEGAVSLKPGDASTQAFAIISQPTKKDGPGRALRFAASASGDEMHFHIFKNEDVLQTIVDSLILKGGYSCFLYAVDNTSPMKIRINTSIECIAREPMMTPKLDKLNFFIEQDNPRTGTVINARFLQAEIPCEAGKCVGVETSFQLPAKSAKYRVTISADCTNCWYLDSKSFAMHPDSVRVSTIDPIAKTGSIVLTAERGISPLSEKGSESSNPNADFEHPLTLEFQFNSLGVPYPRVAPYTRFGLPLRDLVPFPKGPFIDCREGSPNKANLELCPKRNPSLFASVTASYYFRRFYDVPKDSTAFDFHHIKPVSCSGSSEHGANGVWLQKPYHAQFTKWWSKYIPCGRDIPRSQSQIFRR